MRSVILCIVLTSMVSSCKSECEKFGEQEAISDEHDFQNQLAKYRECESSAFANSKPGFFDNLKCGDMPHFDPVYSKRVGWARCLALSGKDK